MRSSSSRMHLRTCRSLYARMISFGDHGVAPYAVAPMAIALATADSTIFCANSGEMPSLALGLVEGFEAFRSSLSGCAG